VKEIELLDTGASEPKWAAFALAEGSKMPWKQFPMVAPVNDKELIVVGGSSRLNLVHYLDTETGFVRREQVTLEGKKIETTQQI